MNILIVSLAGEGAMLIPQLRAEGHDVILHIKEHDAKKIGDGIFFKTDDPDSIAPQADLIIVAENGLASFADKYRKLGYNVWGGGEIADRLEYDRLFGMKVFRDCGVTIPETFEVESIQDVNSVMAEDFSEKEKAVIKLDSSEFAGSCFSFVASSREQLLNEVNHWIDDGKLGNKWSGIIQKFVKGIEVSAEGFWNGSEFSNANITIEEKKMLPGDLGPNVGCAFNTITRISPQSRLFKQQIEPIAGFLRSTDYVGHLDVNSIVADDGTAYALEFTPRVGYESGPTFAWGNPSGYGNAVAEALGIADFDGNVNERGSFWCAVRLWIPPYPFQCRSSSLSKNVYDEVSGVPVTINEDFSDSLIPFDVMKSDGQLICTGANAIVGIALGGGGDVAEAGKAAYKVAQKISVPNLAYRWGDGWNRALRDIDSLLDMRLIRLV